MNNEKQYEYDRDYEKEYNQIFNTIKNNPNYKYIKDVIGMLDDNEEKISVKVISKISHKGS